MVEYYHTNDLVKFIVICNDVQRKCTFLIQNDAILPAVYLTEKYSPQRRKETKLNKKTLLLMDGNLDENFSVFLLSINNDSVKRHLNPM